MASRIEYNVEKVFDRGPKHGFLEVQVTFEEKAPPGAAQSTSFAQVVVSLAKAEVGSKSFEELRVMALSKAVSFIEECARSAAKG
jgi:hypothetical protein